MVLVFSGATRHGYGLRSFQKGKAEEPEPSLGSGVVWYVQRSVQQ